MKTFEEFLQNRTLMTIDELKQKVFRPSTADIWVRCPGFQTIVDFERIFENQKQLVNAREFGSFCHFLAEMCLKKKEGYGLNEILEKNPKAFFKIKTYVEFCQKLQRKNGVCEIEKEISLEGVLSSKTANGTVDFLHFDFSNQNNPNIKIVDLKTGDRPVKPNSFQMKIYGFGIFKKFPRAKKVTLIVVQNKEVKKFVLYKSQSLSFQRKVFERSKPISSENENRVVFNPGVPQCRFCSNKISCSAYSKFQEKKILRFDKKTNYSMHEMVDFLKKGKLFNDFLEEIKMKIKLKLKENEDEDNQLVKVRGFVKKTWDCSKKKQEIKTKLIELGFVEFLELKSPKILQNSVDIQFNTNLSQMIEKNVKNKKIENLILI